MLATVPFLPSLSNEFLNWDDDKYVYNNALVKDFGWQSVRQMFARPHYTDYSPVYVAALGVEYRLVGGRALGFRLVGVLLHVAGALLVSRLIRRLGGGTLAAFLGAGLFAAHPVQVESVSWITEQKNLLSLIFLLVSLLAYVRSRQRAEQRWLWYAASLIAALAAYFTKPSTVILPLLLALYELCFQRRRRGWLVAVGLLPFAAFALLAALLGVQAQRAADAVATWHGGSLPSHVFTMLPVYLDYLRLFLAPYGLTAHCANVIHRSLDVPVLAGMVFVLVVVAAAAYLWRRNRKGFFWLLWVPVSLLPVANLVPMRILMAERYLHLPMVGLAAAAGLLCAAGWRHAHARALRMGYLVLACLMLILPATLSFSHARDWRDSLSLWKRTVLYTPGEHVPRFQLGAAYFADELYEQARREFDRVPIRAGQRNDDLYMLWYNRGATYLQLGKQDPARFDEARRDLRRAVALRPYEANCWHRLAIAFQKLGRAREEAFAQANARGASLMHAGRLAEAESELLAALSFTLDRHLTHFNLGLLYRKMGRWAEAQEHFRQCLRTAPPDFAVRPDAEQLLRDIEREMGR